MRFEQKILVALTGIASFAIASVASAQTLGEAPPVDVSAINEATCWLLYFTQGSYGMLLTGTSAVGAVAAAAVGSVRNALNCAIVALACWLIHPTAVYIFDYDVDCGKFNINLPSGLSKATDPS